MRSSLADEDNDDDGGHARKKMLLLLVLASMKKKKAREFRRKLNKEGRLRRQRGLPRVSLLNPANSPWTRLCESAHDGALIAITGFDRDAFQHLLELFSPYFEGCTPWVKNQDGFNYKRLKPTERRGRKRMVTAISCLGLVLAWHRFNGGEFTLQGWFGFTGGHANTWLRFGRRMLLKALEGEPDALARMPSDEGIEFCQKAMHKRHASLKNVCCFADGLKLNFESCDDPEEQGMYYNGWTHGHYVTNLLVFSATGRIIDGVMNVPGSIHDSTLAVWGGTHKRLKKVHERTGGICAVDSAFATNAAPYWIRSARDTNKAHSAAEIVRMTEATSLRQAAEWGMRAT